MVSFSTSSDLGDDIFFASAGYLHIFRGHSHTPWCKVSELRQITCVAVGDLLNLGQNQVIALNMEGTCFVYAFSSKKSEPGTEVFESGESRDICQRSQLLHKQLLQTNAKMILIGDVDGDGQNEMLLCHTDRNVSACRWMKSYEMLVSLQEWKLRQSVGGITLHGKNDRGLPQIMATQPGCSCAVLHPLWTPESTEPVTCDDEAAVSYNPMSSLSRSQNPAISCSIVGDISKGPQSHKGYFALCTLDGTIKLMEDDQVLWSIQVGHQLFAMNKLDVLGNGKEEVIVCAWSGFTYIVDHDRNVVKFPYEGNVQAFCAGQYAIEDGDNIASMVYANFRNKLYLYYDIRLPQLRMSNFLTEMESSEEIMTLLTELGAETEEERRSLVRYCMYGIQCGTDEEMSGDKIELFKRKSNEA